MEVFTNIYFNDKFSDLQRSSVTIGNFDGCHLGHQNLIKTAIEFSRSSDTPLRPLAITFAPTAEQYFNQQPTRHNLFSPNQKTQALSELGLDTLIYEAFDEKFSHVTHQEFLDKLLINKLDTKALAIGYDFKFGYHRLGDFKFLLESCKHKDIQLRQLDPVMLGDEIISSSKIRSYLLDGEIDLANKMLGRPYMILGTVEKGDQLGRTMNFPTANLNKLDQLVPGHGVYCGWTYIENDADDNQSILKIPKDIYPTIMNIGIRPTVNNNQQLTRCEAHILDEDFGGSLYGKKLRVYFHSRIRSEEKFPDIATLKNAIAKDINVARKRLNIKSL